MGQSLVKEERVSKGLIAVLNIRLRFNILRNGIHKEETVRERGECSDCLALSSGGVVELLSC